MVFSSIVFLGIFLPLTLFAYFICKNRQWRNFVLLVTSLFFYAWGEPVYVVLMVLVTLIDYIFGRLIDKHGRNGATRLLLAVCIVLNLLPLFAFKYYNFLAIEFGQLVGVSFPLLSAAMPIGISFFTFQSMSYAIDVYRGSVKAQRNYAYVLLYVSMFPQLIAGPIVRYSDIETELNQRVETAEGFSEGSFRFAIGLGKKVILANYAGKVAAYLLNDRLSGLSSLGAWIGLSLAALQLYFDFSGYSDMAIGLGRIFGFHFKENFRYPHMSRSVTEFWSRWHISLGNWFRDYVMYPIAMSKPFTQLTQLSRKRLGPQTGKLVPYAITSLVTFSLIGIWHGAGWNFLLWGVYFVPFLVIERALILRGKFQLSNIPVLSTIIVLAISTFGFALFYYTDMSELGRFFQALFGASGNGFLLDLRERSAVGDIFWLLPVLALGPWPLCAFVCKRIFGKGKAFTIARTLYTVVLIGVCYILLLGQGYNAFLYFRF